VRRCPLSPENGNVAASYMAAGKTQHVPRSRGSGEEGGASGVEGVGAVPFDHLA
jgi:hypothetical protein